MEDYPSILDELDRGAPISITRIGGGCIADSGIAKFADGSRVFVKSAKDATEMFVREAQGLRTLAAAAVIRVPEILAVSGNALVLEMIRSVPKRLNPMSTRYREANGIDDVGGDHFPML